MKENMEVKMNGTTVIQKLDKVICKCEAKAFDKRTEKVEILTLYFELTENEVPNTKAERILGKLGYYFHGFDTQPITVSVSLSAEEMFTIGKAQE